jgi:hypothetical protein
MSVSRARYDLGLSSQSSTSTLPGGGRARAFSTMHTGAAKTRASHVTPDYPCDSGVQRLAAPRLRTGSFPRSSTAGMRAAHDASTGPVAPTQTALRRRRLHDPARKQWSPRGGVRSSTRARSFSINAGAPVSRAHAYDAAVTGERKTATPDRLPSLVLKLRKPVRPENLVSLQDPSAGSCQLGDEPRSPLASPRLPDALTRMGARRSRFLLAKCCA